ncbi:MAG: hypothetical protein OHK0036_00770 [Bacteroidia bacterium]
MYEVDKKNNVDSLFTKEFYIYGSSRLGYLMDKIFFIRILQALSIQRSGEAASLLRALKEIKFLILFCCIIHLPENQGSGA